MNKKLQPTIDLTRILKPFENKWVALSLDRKKVLGSGSTIAQTKKEADKTKKTYLFHKVVPFNLHLVPNVQ